MTRWEVLPDKTVTEKDKTESVSSKLLRPMTGRFPGGQSQGLDTQSWRVDKISNMFDPI